MSSAYTIEKLFELAVHEQASDVHINPGEAPTLRVDGLMNPINAPKLTPADTEMLAKSILPAKFEHQIETKGAADFGVFFHDRSFRVNIYKTAENYAIVARIIPENIRPMAELGLPKEVQDLIVRPRGLILVTGPTGSGKSTTLASMVDAINKTQSGHVVTIEDPIEYRHKHDRCLISQRQIGTDVSDFATGVRHALREDPDVILVGEMRDLETIEAVISAAETGHLVFSTVHTTGATRTVDRIIDAFPSEAKDYVRTQLSMNLLCVISQVLCKRKTVGRVPAFEIMLHTDAIGSLIREGKTHRITSELQTGKRFGMITLDAHLAYLYKSGVIDKTEALAYAQDLVELEKELQ